MLSLKIIVFSLSIAYCKINCPANYEMVLDIVLLLKFITVSPINILLSFSNLMLMVIVVVLLSIYL